MELGEFKKIEARKIWPNEHQNFTPWLAEDQNIANLGESLGLELEVEKVEASVGPYSADILAKETGTGKYVVIENQLSKTNHDHLGKLITYGSVLDASAVVWIASEFTEEHHRALDWLNDYTSEDLAFYGVSLEVEQIDDSRPAVRFNVISRPAGIKRTEATGEPGEISPKRKMQLEFWTSFRDKILKAKVVASAHKPRAQYWFNVPLGRSGIFLSNIADTSGNRIGVRIYINNKVAEKALPQLVQQKDAIEKEIGEKLIWDASPDAKDKVIAIYHSIDFENRENWDEYLEWLVDMVTKFRKSFMPRIKKLTL